MNPYTPSEVYVLLATVETAEDLKEVNDYLIEHINKYSFVHATQFLLMIGIMLKCFVRDDDRLS